MTSKFEKKYGRYAIRNLSLYLIIGYVIGYVIELINPEVYSYFMFNPYMIFHGQIWRLVTWVLIPPEELGIFTIIMLLLYYQLGQSLERAWGTYRYNVYIFLGFLFTVAGGLVLYVILGLVYGQGMDTAYYALGMNIGICVSTYYINMSIFLAYAATYPEEKLLLYFIIPVKVKWFGVIYAAYIVFDIIQAFVNYTAVQATIITVLIVMSLLNFFVYFIRSRKNRWNPKQVKRRRQYQQSVKTARTVSYEGGAKHKCVVCGRTELDDPNLTFRYCSKCSGNKEYCQDHLFTHTHQ